MGFAESTLYYYFLGYTVLYSASGKETHVFVKRDSAFIVMKNGHLSNYLLRTHYFNVF